jgi:uncharacterized protein
MTLKTETDVLRIISEDKWMMDILRSVRMLGLKDWCICAGFVRTKIWDTIHEYTERTELSDIDVVFFDKEMTDERIEKELEAHLAKIHQGLPWSVKNQARMHVINDIPPYTSTEDAISKFPETATALGVAIEADGNLRLIAPHSIHDALELKIRPTPFFRTSKRLMRIFENRLVSKSWHSVWPGLIVEEKSGLSMEVKIFGKDTKE